LKNGRYREVIVAVTVSVVFYLLIGVEAAMAWFSVFQVALALWRLASIGEFFFWLIFFLMGLEVTALVHWALLPFGVVTPLVWFADLELALFYVLAPMAPPVVLAIILIVILKLLVPQYLIIAKRFFRGLFSSESESDEEKIRMHPKMFLVASVALSIVAALYPYSGNINPDGIAFGVDVHYYIDWMDPVTQDLYSAFTVANGSRPVMLWLIYGVQQGLGLKLLDAIKYLPVLLNPLLVLSVYFMVSQATGDQEWAGLASMFTASEFKITVGMYTYFLTNMLGLILVFSALSFLFKTIQTGNKVYFALASGLSSLLVFTHPWTFAQYYAAIVLFLVYIYFLEKRYKESVFVFAFLGFTGFVDVIKGAIGGMEAYSAITSTVPRLIRIVDFWSNNIFAFRQMYGGLLSNTVLLGLTVFGVYLLNRKKRYDLFLMLLLLVSLAYYLMVSGSEQTKLLYNIPFSVLSSLAILFLLRNTSLDRRKRMVAILFTITYMIVYLLRSLANLV